MRHLYTRWIGLAGVGVLAACAAPPPEDAAQIGNNETAILSALYEYADRLRNLDSDERLRELQARVIDDADSCREPRKRLELALLLSDPMMTEWARARRLLAGCLNVVPGPLLTAYIRSRLDALAQIERLAHEAAALRDQLETLEQALTRLKSREARIASLETRNRALKARIKTLETQIKELSSIEKNLQPEGHTE